MKKNGIVYIGFGEDRIEGSMKYSKGAIFYIKYDSSYFNLRS